MPSCWPSSLQFVKDFDRTNYSIKSEESTSTDELDDDQNNDSEGVWSPDIEQSFHEALAIYPACGRRKIILSDEGKMFGRNELISRYIKMRTGKLRTRKQVSSHIQVLAKRKTKEIQTLFKDSNFKESHRSFVINQHYHQLRNVNPTSTIISDNTSSYYNTPVSLFSPTSTTPFIDIKSYTPTSTNDFISTTTHCINSNRLKLVEFAGYIQSKSDMDLKHYLLRISHEAGTDMKSEKIKMNQIVDLFPMLKELYHKVLEDVFYVVKVWVNMDYQDNSNNTYHYYSIFESLENNLNICITTKACSFGNTIVEKIENGTMKYNEMNDKCIHRSMNTTMCTFMTDFITKLKTGMYTRDKMNSVLEHLGVLQTVVAKDTNELLLCIAYIFEISESSSLNGTQSAAYRLCD
ncbi:unnamed protein product [Adineta steineri]|uniref:TEA domain-containing protein n=2 Tax=Adineta steineri TaxID=433720 RepID=A0A814FGZ7_9BILA|nr:unnamed protein product [Adineta steineri]CAF3687695.1 unnamed protein product [Adineta steineri]